MTMLREAFFAFRARRFAEWLLLDRPQIPLILGLSFYAGWYFQYKYDWISRAAGRQPFDNYAYVKKADELQRANGASLSSSPTPDLPTSTPPDSSIPDSLAATGIS